MGFYLRKSIRVGPFRYNLSKSGIGVSVGVKGLRIGTGPRGNYVHMGRGGLYYRKTFLSPEDKKTSYDNYRPASHPDTIPNNTHAPLTEIESGTVFAMTDSSSVELLNELNSKRKKWQFWPLILVIGTVLTILSSWHLFGIVATAIFTFGAYYYDRLRKTVVLFYELDNNVEPLYEALHNTVSEMALCKKVWHIEAEGKVYDKKYHAGADNVIRRKTTSIKKKRPSFVKTNITVPAIDVGKQTLFFFPDRLLVFDNNAVGAVSYKNLDIRSYTSNFIEDEAVPKDSVVVGRTWKYVNKKGGPDKRFGDNRQIPVVEYGYVDITSSTGLNKRICLSKTDKGILFEKAIISLAEVSKNKISL